MNAKDFDLMGRISPAEISGSLNGHRGVYQGRSSKRLKELEAEGMIYEVEFAIPGRFPVTVKGYAHTIRGNILYCEECSRREEKEVKA